MNFLGEIGKLQSRFGCLSILKCRFQCLKVVNQQQYVEVAKESTKMFVPFCIILHCSVLTCLQYKLYEHLCVVGSHKTHRQRATCHESCCFYNVSSVPASRSHGNGASRLQFVVLFFLFRSRLGIISVDP